MLCLIIFGLVTNILNILKYILMYTEIYLLLLVNSPTHMNFCEMMSETLHNTFKIKLLYISFI
jgi:hypothetical protein